MTEADIYNRKLEEELRVAKEQVRIAMYESQKAREAALYHLMRCPRCNGEGCVELAPAHKEVMTLMDTTRAETITSAELVEQLGLSISNASNRLKKLNELGVLEREITICPSGGQEYVYRRK